MQIIEIKLWLVCSSVTSLRIFRTSFLLRTQLYSDHSTLIFLFNKYVSKILYILYIYIYIYIHTNLPVNVIVRPPHPRSRDSQGQETFLAPSAGKQTRNYDTACSNHHLSLSTLRSKGLSRSNMKWWAIYVEAKLIILFFLFFI